VHTRADSINPGRAASAAAAAAAAAALRPLGEPFSGCARLAGRRAWARAPLPPRNEASVFVNDAPVRSAAHTSCAAPLRVNASAAERCKL
jgi:hypothetical protein